MDSVFTKCMFIGAPPGFEEPCWEDWDHDLHPDDYPWKCWCQLQGKDVCYFVIIPQYEAEEDGYLIDSTYSDLPHLGADGKNKESR